MEEEPKKERLDHVSVQDHLTELLETKQPAFSDDAQWMPTGYFMICEYRALDGQVGLFASSGDTQGRFVAPWTVKGWLYQCLDEKMYGQPVQDDDE